jgi:hypothetical protein
MFKGVYIYVFTGYLRVSIEFIYKVIYIIADYLFQSLDNLRIRETVIAKREGNKTQTDCRCHVNKNDILRKYWMVIGKNSYFIVYGFNVALSDFCDIT